MAELVCKYEQLVPGKLIKYFPRNQNRTLSYKDFICSLAYDSEFRKAFNALLIDAPFKAFRFETPSLTANSINQPFEFVLINAPGLLNHTADPYTFEQYFEEESSNTNHGIVEFKSLGGDATLIAPSPRTSFEAYNHLANFTRSAPELQIDALWKKVGSTLHRESGTTPLWLNTEGSGVAWLHIRIDTRPKYYGYKDYTVPP